MCVTLACGREQEILERRLLRNLIVAKSRFQYRLQLIQLQNLLGFTVIMLKERIGILKIFQSKQLMINIYDVAVGKGQLQMQALENWKKGKAQNSTMPIVFIDCSVCWRVGPSESQFLALI